MPHVGSNFRTLLALPVTCNLSIEICRKYYNQGKYIIIVERTRGLEVWHGTRCMGVTEPLKLFVCNIRKYILSYAILESTFVCNIRKYFLWPSAPPFCFTSARCINFCFASARCINFYRHFWVVFGGVGQYVTLSVTARPLIWLPEEFKFSFWWGLKACPHSTTDPDLTSQIASALHH